MTSQSNELFDLLRCTKCNSHNLINQLGFLECGDCLETYPIINGVPVFLEDFNKVRVMPVDHISNQLPLEIVSWLENLSGYSLNIGAGATRTKISKCIEIEYSIWKNTNIVGDAHCLPFKDETFDAVVCFNVFEHLHNPVVAASEIFRILKPSGRLILHTAFLQPLHEEPIHFYNATKYGVINWFSDFDIEKCQVSENFNPALTLGWLTSELLNSIKQQYGREHYDKLAKTTLDSWSQIWAIPSKRNGFLWDSLLNLAQSKQEKFSAGFELVAIKPSNSVLGNTTEPTKNHTISFKTNKTELESLSAILANQPDDTDSLISMNCQYKNRLLVMSRLQSAKVFESMGQVPWTSMSNSHYKLCENPCVSVIITLYNYSNYINECLESVSNSKFKNFSNNVEIIVVDDCSTDTSAKIVEEYLLKSNAPICLIKKYLNTGLADARNTGLKIARSPYVFILDADNWIHTNCLSVLYEKISSSNYAAVYGKIRRFDNQTKQEFDVISDTDWDTDALVQNPYIDAMAMFDVKILFNVGGYSTELVEYGWFGWEDYDLWLKLAQHDYSCKLVPKILSSYRLHSSSMINTTGNFVLNMSRYFDYKFSGMSSKNTKSDKLFGSWRSDVYSGTHHKLTSSPNSPVISTDQVSITSTNQSRLTVEAMRSSKFWKIRSKWFKLKQILGLIEDFEE